MIPVMPDGGLEHRVTAKLNAALSSARISPRPSAAKAAHPLLRSGCFKARFAEGLCRRMPHEDKLVRTTFRTNRDSDFIGRDQLAKQIGHPAPDWLVVAFKELVDNGIDIAEEHGTVPDITVEVTSDRKHGGAIAVTDNGPGLPAKTIKDIRDFSLRVSSREAYVSPTRGQLGNALKCLLAMPTALAGDVSEQPGSALLIEAHGFAHHLEFIVDPVHRTISTSDRSARSDVKKGTRITLCIPPNACVLLDNARPRFLQLASVYGLYNPHLSLSLTWNGKAVGGCAATLPEWSKWRGSDPIPAHWYDAARLERLLAAYLAHHPETTAHQFISKFRGLSGSQKPTTVLDQAQLGRPSLAAFFAGGRVDHEAIARLLASMRANSRAVPPEQLGIIGSGHLKTFLIKDDDEFSRDSFRYRRATGVHDDVPMSSKPPLLLMMTNDASSCRSIAGSIGRHPCASHSGSKIGMPA